MAWNSTRHRRPSHVKHRLLSPARRYAVAAFCDWWPWLVHDLAQWGACPALTNTEHCRVLLSWYHGQKSHNVAPYFLNVDIFLRAKQAHTLIWWAWTQRTVCMDSWNVRLEPDGLSGEFELERGKTYLSRCLVHGFDFSWCLPDIHPSCNILQVMMFS